MPAEQAFAALGIEEISQLIPQPALAHLQPKMLPRHILHRVRFI